MANLKVDQLNKPVTVLQTLASHLILWVKKYALYSYLYSTVFEIPILCDVNKTSSSLPAMGICQFVLC